MKKRRKTPQTDRKSSNSGLLPSFGQVAFYLRLSLADGDLGDGKDESNSIENQRALLRDYLLRQIKREGEPLDDRIPIEENSLLCDYLASVTEYVDDGYTGLNFNRPGFKRMIEDAAKRRINTILVKDTSRLGRDYIEVGDYMEQIFPRLGIRLIAVNMGYDSESHRGSLMGLEAGMTNLIYSEYSRDLSKKVTSARRTKWNQGIPTSGRAPFGYLMQNKKYAVDKEAADYVRFIFEKAAGGWTTAMLVDHLNEKRIPAPGVYRKQKTGWDSRGRRVFDEEWLWNQNMVHSIIRNYSYTGNMVHGKTRLIAPCLGIRKAVDKKEWYILKGTHEAIVSQEVWEKAQTAIKSIKKTNRLSCSHPLRGKVRCGSCGLVMNIRESTKTIVCQHSYTAGRLSRCERTLYSEEWVSGAVLREMNQQLKSLELLRVQIEAQRGKRRQERSGKDTKKQIEALKAEKVRQYEAYAMGRLSRETFMRRRDELNVRARRLEEDQKRHDAMTEKKRRLLSELYAIEQAVNEIRKEEKNERFLNQAMIQALIEDVWIYDKKHIRIVFTFDDLSKRAVEYLKSNEEERRM